MPDESETVTVPGESETVTVPCRRRAVVLFSADLLSEMLKGARCARVIEGAVPRDARCVGAQFDLFYQAWVIVYEHASFPEVWEGGPMLLLPPVVVRACGCDERGD